VRWIHLPVRLDECSAAANAIDLLREAIEAAVAREAQGRLLVCRVELTGQTRLHGELLSSADQFLAEARASALGLGEEVAWIERLVIATANPEGAASRMDALGELQGMMETAASDFDLQAQLASDIGDLVRKLPHDIRAHSEDAALRAAIDGNIAGLITHAGAYLSARLGAEKV
jgi:DNA repair protein SbcD/Mre11